MDYPKGTKHPLTTVVRIQFTYAHQPAGTGACSYLDLYTPTHDPVLRIRVSLSGVSQELVKEQIIKHVSKHAVGYEFREPVPSGLLSQSSQEDAV